MKLIGSSEKMSSLFSRNASYILGFRSTLFLHFVPWAEAFAIRHLGIMTGSLGQLFLQCKLLFRYGNRWLTRLVILLFTFGSCFL